MKVVISGCCVSRDIFNYDRYKEFEVEKFIQLNPISCTNTRSGGVVIPDNFDTIHFRSNFIKKCALCALSNNMLQTVLDSNATFLILDLAEERIPKACINDGDTEVAIAKHAFFDPMTDAINNHILSPLKLHEIRFNGLSWDDVAENYSYFANQINERFGKNIIIIEVYMGDTFVNSNYELEKFTTLNSGFSQQYISDVNKYLKKLYTLLERLLPESKIIKIPDNIISIYYHRWGLNPLHFTSDVYEYLIRCIGVITGCSNENSLEALYEELKFKNQMIIYVLTHMKQ